ncbi:hypothetical protein Tco_0566918 [Tanacetum coccineum]
MPSEMELTLETNPTGVVLKSRVLSDIDDSHGPSDAMHNPPIATQSQKDFVSKLTEYTLIFYCTHLSRILTTAVENPVMEDSSYIESYLITGRSFSDPKRRLQTLKVFQEWYEHVGPEVASPQNGKVTRWRRDCAWLMISRCSRSQCQIQVQGTSSIQEVNDHYNIFTREKSRLLVFFTYQDPQGFIYVNNNGRNRLMRSDEHYKFCDRTLTVLRTSLDDITKNIRMEYLPKRRWSTLEKKRAHIMIKAIGKQLKERRLTRSLEKFVGGRHYGTDLRLLHTTI